MRDKCCFILSLCLFACMLEKAFAQEDTYTIAPGDMIEISVWKDEYLSRQVIVPPDGVLSFPLIGDLNVDNLTVAGLRQAAETRLAEFVPGATVTVMILQFNSLKAFVIGKVNNPGAFPINMNTTVMQILSMAGGLNAYASSGDIFVLRQDTIQADEKSYNYKIPFNYKQVLKGKNLKQNIVLKRGDVVVVP